MSERKLKQGCPKLHLDPRDDDDYGLMSNPATQQESDTGKLLLDKVGIPITVGCYIAYGHALGRSAGLRIGKVLEICELKKSEFGGDYREAKLTVIGVDDDSSWDKRGPHLNSKASTLNFPSRMIVLPTVPEPHKSLLDGFVWVKKSKKKP